MPPRGHSELQARSNMKMNSVDFRNRNKSDASSTKNNEKSSINWFPIETYLQRLIRHRQIGSRSFQFCIYFRFSPHIQAGWRKFLRYLRLNLDPFVISPSESHSCAMCARKDRLETFIFVSHICRGAQVLWTKLTIFSRRPADASW